MKNVVPPGPPPEETGKYGEALRALQDYAAEVLGSESKDRFVEVGRICNVAQSLVQSRSRRVADFACTREDMQNYNADEDGPDCYQGQIAAPALRMNNMYPALAFGPVDERQLMREMLNTVGPHAQHSAESLAAATAAHEAEELQHMLLIYSIYPQKSSHVEERIAYLQKRLQNRMDSVQEKKNADLVPTDVSRGHKIGIGGERNGSSGIGDDSERSVSDGSSQDEMS